MVLVSTACSRLSHIQPENVLPEDCYITSRDLPVFGLLHFMLDGRKFLRTCRNEEEEEEEWEEEEEI
jgi:hypothetical protein